jgi:lipopolysaccharide transport system ATP-binding protein
MSTPVIRAEGLSKQYRIGTQPAAYGRLSEALWTGVTGMAGRLRGHSRNGSASRAEDSYIWALEDLSFEVQEGEVVGVVGRNGAGKTTLLKLLSRITEPTRGRAELTGRVGSLLEVGTGFHPELTGRENVFLNGAILGMGRNEIRRKFDEIVAFAEIERFIDTPVKRYSSGMYVRLAFAVAAHFEPEILIIDEVLAVGDAGFQKKCLGKMNEVARQGRTVLFVSHNVGAVSELCTRGLLLTNGRKVMDGDVGPVLDEYSRLNALAGGASTFEDRPDLPCAVVAAGAYAEDGKEEASFDLSQSITLRVDLRVRERIGALIVAMTITRNMVDVFHTFASDGRPGLEEVDPGDYRMTCHVPAQVLKAGLYSVRIATTTPDTDFQSIENAIQFEVEERSENTHLKGYRRDRPGIVIFPGTWNTERIA